MSKKHIIAIFIAVVLLFGGIMWYSHTHITGADIEFIAKLDEAEYVNMTVTETTVLTGMVVSADEYRLCDEKIAEMQDLLVSSKFVLKTNKSFYTHPEVNITDCVIYVSFSENEGYYIYSFAGEYVDIMLESGAILIPSDEDFQKKLIAIVE